VLIVAPLAVAEQTVAEAAKFGIPGIAYAAGRRACRVRSGRSPTTTAPTASTWATSPASCSTKARSSRASDGKTRAGLTEACADRPLPPLLHATPAPNDWTEIGQHAEFLGVMSRQGNAGDVFRP
jgi:hypothetical protein